jgi:hypothetical protein
MNSYQQIEARVGGQVGQDLNGDPSAASCTAEHSPIAALY